VTALISNRQPVVGDFYFTGLCNTFASLFIEKTDAGLGGAVGFWRVNFMSKIYFCSSGKNAYLCRKFHHGIIPNDHTKKISERQRNPNFVSLSAICGVLP